MRNDFGRIVIERERRGSSSRNFKPRRAVKLDCRDPDWREWSHEGNLHIPTAGLRGVKRAHDGKLAEKDFSDVLRPIEGYLHKSIGRKWDDVYSELSRALGRGDLPTRHVLTAHTLTQVARNTYEENGRVYAQSGRGAYGHYFVDPRDGTLRREADQPRRRYVPEPLDRHYWQDGVWFVRIASVWYLGAYTSNAGLANYTPHQTLKQDREYAALYKTLNYQEQARSRHARAWPNLDGWWFVKWRQASKRDLKALRKLLLAEVTIGK